MPKVGLFNIEGNRVGEIDLNAEVFSVPANPHLLHRAVTAYLANRRQGTHATKTRAMVAGGGRKPWRQKGTGRARHGSIRSPIWRKGGIVFGPHPRKYRLELSRKERRAALRQALSAKLDGNELVILDSFTLEKPQTKAVANLMAAFGAAKALVVTADGDHHVYKSARNIPGTSALGARDLNTYQVLRAGRVFLTRDAVNVLEEVLA